VNRCVLTYPRAGGDSGGLRNADFEWWARLETPVSRRMRSLRRRRGAAPVVIFCFDTGWNVAGMLLRDGCNGSCREFSVEGRCGLQNLSRGRCCIKNRARGDTYLRIRLFLL